MTAMSNRAKSYVSEKELEIQKTYMQEVKEINKDKQLKYHIVTYGCQMNVHDSEKLSGMLNYMGYTWTDNQEEADLILFNTCCVREHAELRVYGNIGALKAMKQSNPNMIIGVCGCMMQQKEVSDHIQKRFPYVDMIFGTHNLHTFPEILWKAITSGHAILEVWEGEGSIVEDIPVQRREGCTAWVTIMYGCNNFCTYCIVPYVRGRERSREAADIINEVKELVSQGYKEVTLLGQNVNSYGKDLKDPLTFAGLLRKLDAIEGLYRIRFMTSHPKDLSEELIQVMGECKKVCNQLHLPVQSGSSRILKAMNRNYTRENYLDLVKRIRDKVPDIGLSTYIIVGFPGETEEDFEQTLKLVEEVRYDSAFTFIYSKRTGTPAAKREEQVEEQVKKERLSRLNQLQDSISLQKNQEYLHRMVEVLVEGPSKKNSSILMGKTETGKTVNFSGSRELIGQLINIKINHVKAHALYGEII